MATKRSNPFVEDFMPQSKVHLGLKQFNNNEERLQKVYEKTLELLFRGAKKSCQDIIQNEENSTTYKKDGMKQLVIGKGGFLVTSEHKIEDKPLYVRRCSCGVCEEATCKYCERSLCPSCQHYCCRCHCYHCSKCSLIGDAAAEEAPPPPPAPHVEVLEKRSSK
ncbi:Apoptosis regulatory protein Siva [Papilio xuthus]|uniref:Apoptosis regulatory protein Siva n=1 Tax=Papilio xuthus TaxID=66420 RepID=A0A194PPD8_PAPXU|nr:Apoptosis regulatory protein Siva [Papilio xuthus]